MPPNGEVNDMLAAWKIQEIVPRWWQLTLLYIHAGWQLQAAAWWQLPLRVHTYCLAKLPKAVPFVLRSEVEGRGARNKVA